MCAEPLRAEHSILWKRIQRKAKTRPKKPNISYLDWIKHQIDKSESHSLRISRITARTLHTSEPAKIKCHGATVAGRARAVDGPDCAERIGPDLRLRGALVARAQIDDAPRLLGRQKRSFADLWVQSQQRTDELDYARTFILTAVILALY